MNKGYEDESGKTDVIVKKQNLVKEPPLYCVFLLNDDYTPMDFVVEILEKYFDKNHAEATTIMLRIHNEGRAACGTYPYEIAETKVSAVTNDARKDGFPLECSIDKL